MTFSKPILHLFLTPLSLFRIENRVLTNKYEYIINRTDVNKSKKLHKFELLAKIYVLSEFKESCLRLR